MYGQLALTAASPLWRGYIADVDCRWDVISACVDDRTEEERGLKVMKSNKPQRECGADIAVAAERKPVQDTEVSLQQRQSVHFRPLDKQAGI